MNLLQEPPPALPTQDQLAWAKELREYCRELMDTPMAMLSTSEAAVFLKYSGLVPGATRDTVLGWANGRSTHYRLTNVGRSNRTDKVNGRKWKFTVGNLMEIASRRSRREAA